MPRRPVGIDDLVGTAGLAVPEAGDPTERVGRGDAPSRRVVGVAGDGGQGRAGGDGLLEQDASRAVASHGDAAGGRDDARGQVGLGAGRLGGAAQGDVVRIGRLAALCVGAAHDASVRVADERDGPAVGIGGREDAPLRVVGEGRDELGRGAGGDGAAHDPAEAVVLLEGDASEDVDGTHPTSAGVVLVADDAAEGVGRRDEVAVLVVGEGGGRARGVGHGGDGAAGVVGVGPEEASARAGLAHETVLLVVLAQGRDAEGVGRRDEVAPDVELLRGGDEGGARHGASGQPGRRGQARRRVGAHAGLHVAGDEEDVGV